MRCSATNPSIGTDGPGTKAYSLVVNNGTNSGLFDSQTNATISLYQVDATTIEGRPEVSGSRPGLVPHHHRSGRPAT